jgi:outer membrane immunogenic protein
MIRATLAALAALSTFVISAHAADLSQPAPAPIYTKAPVLAPTPAWTGFYVGVNGGYGFGSWDGSMAFAQGACCGLGGALGPVGLDTSSHPINSNGGLAGGQIGYNWQFGHVVTGVEGDVDWSDIRGNSGLLIPFPAGFPANGEPFWTFGIRNDWLATVRGRLGYDVGGTLIYGTGGVAFGGFHETHDVVNTAFAACTPPCATATLNETKVGWTAGAGVERALNNNWSIKAEYLYVSFANVGGIMPWDDFARFGTGTDGFKGDFDVHTFRGGINYKF